MAIETVYHRATAVLTTDLGLHITGELTDTLVIVQTKYSFN